MMSKLPLYTTIFRSELSNSFSTEKEEISFNILSNCYILQNINAQWNNPFLSCVVKSFIIRPAEVPTIFNAVNKWMSDRCTVTLLLICQSWL